MTGFLTTALLILGLLFAAPQEAEQKTDQFFSGTVTEFGSDRVVVERQVLGKNSEKRTFVINADTKVEGQLQRNSRVTVRFMTGEEGDVAVSIIVRKKT